MDCGPGGQAPSEGTRLFPPEDGNAKKALIALLAETLDIPKSAIRIAAGETSRLKTIAIDGDSAALQAKLSEL